MEITNGNKSFCCVSHSFIVQSVEYIDGKIYVKTVIQSNASNTVNFDKSNALN